jgi:tetratricopeptide (TPR) repeat protein
MNLGWLLYDRGEFDSAVVAAQRVLASRATMGDEHPAIGSTLVLLGQSQLRLNRVAEAEASVRDALRVRSASLPRTHWLVASTESALGEVLTARRRFAEAERLLLGALERLRTQRGEDAEATVSTRARLVALYERWGKGAEAAKYRKQAR